MPAPISRSSETRESSDNVKKRDLSRFLAPRVLAAMLVCCLAAPYSAAAGDDVDLEIAEQRAFRAAVDRVAPSVVRIETVGGLGRVGRVLFGDGPTTGLIVDKDGYIISSAFNFINLPSRIIVRLPDDTLKPAELVATDHNRMLVLLKIEADGPLPVPEIVPVSEIRVGQWAIAVGRTFEGNRPNVSVGILSAKGRIWGKAVQTDAITSPNNYGGPLVDVAGRVLGVIVPLSPSSATQVAGFQWYDSGIGFAIDAQHVMEILPLLRKGEDLHPGLIGVNLKGSNPSIGEPEITACRPNSPAAKAGLKVGDRIVEIEGRQIFRAAGVKQELSRRYAGMKVRMVVLRNDKRIETQVELAAKLEPYQHPMLGVLPMRDPGGTAGVTAGVTVRWVYPQGPAAAAGIEPGDVIVSLAGEPIKDRRELLLKIAEFQPQQEVDLDVRRGNQTLKFKPTLGRLPEDLPPQELPAARADVEPAETQPPDQPPQVGTVSLKIPELKNESFAYVPQSYNRTVAHGVVVWLHAPGGFDWDKLLKDWKSHCDRCDLILLAPKAEDPRKWNLGEVTLVKKLLDEIGSTYTVDPARVVVHGHQSGGALAYMVGFGNRDLIRAVAAVDAPVSVRPPENDPLNRLAIYMAVGGKPDHAAAIKRMVPKLRQMKIPVTVKDLGELPRYLNPQELAELVRWIDMLDRI